MAEYHHVLYLPYRARCGFTLTVRRARHPPPPPPPPASTSPAPPRHPLQLATPPPQPRSPHPHCNKVRSVHCMYCTILYYTVLYCTRCPACPTAAWSACLLARAASNAPPCARLDTCSTRSSRHGLRPTSALNTGLLARSMNYLDMYYYLLAAKAAL